MLTGNLKSVYWSEKLLNYSVIILRTSWQGRRHPWVCFTKWQVLSRQVKIQGRMAITTGVCYTEQVTSNSNKAKGKFQLSDKCLFHNRDIFLSQSLVTVYCLLTEVVSKLRLVRFRWICNAERLWGQCVEGKIRSVYGPVIRNNRMNL
jgi:hypothetical protein